MSFAQRLKKARIDKGLSQTELGTLAGIHYTQVGRYENKGSQPSAEILSKLANALGVSSDFLTNGTTNEMAENTLSDKELLNQFKAVEQMDDKDKSVIKMLIDAFITKRRIQHLAL
ncbi:MAG: helix-turn-helix transcriptional regulator [Bacteroidales bacterium]|jgi:transcriptional regulator with XRE-family HTH domain|nr:helix-turn-helix transcriptional regulator [Bacteroidales bacterium]